MRLEDIKTTDDLITFLRDFNCWSGEPTCYDTGSVVSLFLALLDNMRENFVTNEDEVFAYYLTDQQRGFLAKLAEYANRLTDRDIEKEDENL